MPFQKIYAEIIEMIKKTVLDTQMCRDILRRSGVQSGVGAQGLPPGGTTGQRLQLNSTATGWDWIDTMAVAERIPELNFSDPDVEPVVTLGIAPRRVIYFGNLRNPSTTPTDYGPEDHVSHGLLPIADHATHQYFIWEDIPSGLYYYPLNVDWFVKKVDLSASTRMNAPVQINVAACVVDGSPAADLQVHYSTSSRTGPWTLLASVDLAPGGVRRGAWVDLPEEAKADVWLSLFINARSSVSTLHLGYAESRVRWNPPSDYWQPQYNWIS